MASLNDLIDSVQKLQSTTTAAQDLVDSLLFAAKHARADDDAAIPSTPSTATSNAFQSMYDNARRGVMLKGRAYGKTTMM